MSRLNFRERSGDRGHAALEFALTIPVLVIALLGSIQVFVLLVDRIHLVHVTRDATRAASIADDPERAVDQVIERSFPGREVTATVERRGDVMTVQVILRNRTEVPVIGRFIPDVEQHESLSMLSESIVER